MIELQRALLADKIRNDAFYAALKKVIKKGQTTVADIGSGTGFLSFLASQLGARECHLYEYSDLLALSKKMAQANGIKNCRFIHSHSTQVKNPAPVDVIISETLGNFALEENIIENIEDAKRFLKPGGIIIPAKIEQFVVPVTSPRIMHVVNVWDDIGFNVDLSLAKKTALNNMYVEKIEPTDVLPKSTKRFDLIDFSRHEKSIRKNTVDWKLAAAATVYGFCVWWSCELVAGVMLSTSPFESRTHWDQIFLPLTAPLVPRAGDTLELRISTDSRYEVGINVAWETRLVRSGKIVNEIKMDMKNGLS